MSWLKSDNDLRNKYSQDISNDDGINNALLEANYTDNPKIGDAISGKRKIISWMLRTWSQEFDMYL